MNDFVSRLGELGPEMVMLAGACVTVGIGLTRSAEVRKLASVVAAITLILAAVVVTFGQNALDPSTAVAMALPNFIKLAVCGMGLLLLALAAGVPDRLHGVKAMDGGEVPFDAALVMRGEFFAFFLLSLTGVMLAAGATDLVWLFLALELTSLPTYVMIATGRDRADASEAAVKYFFLGALGAATFLYGFTLLYGASGSTQLADIRAAIAAAGQVTPLMTAGLALSILGIAFKIAAVPMHFYVADVYQGAPTPLSAFLAFVPKTAGFVALMLILSTVHGAGGNPGLPPAITMLLWVMAALTMTFGNVLGLLQNNVKRVLAYSSVAHSGYMLVGLLGLTTTSLDTPASNGAAAVLFYLVAYGLGNLAAFAVLSCLERNGEEAQDFADLAGLSQKRPALAAVLLLAVLSLIGLPPLLGFVGKIYLFSSAYAQGFRCLIVLAVLNSAISAVYYLRIVNVAYFSAPDEQVEVTNSRLRPAVAGVAVALAIALFLAGNPLAQSAHVAGRGLAGLPASDLPLTAQR